MQAKVDLIELRPDMWMKGSHLHEEEYIPTIVNLVEELHSRYVKMPMLFTWRTLAEGGDTYLTNENYCKLLQAIVDQNLVDAVDVELFAYTDTISQIIKQAHHQNIQTVMSYHNFHSTPKLEILHGYAERMISAGASVIKFALMPTTSDDVIFSITVYKRINTKISTVTTLLLCLWDN